MRDAALKSATEAERKKLVARIKSMEAESRGVQADLIEEVEELKNRLAVFQNFEAIGKTGVVIEPSKSGAASESVALAMYSDNHIEERVDPGTVNGLNRYNPQIARGRNDRFFKTIVDLVEIERHGTPINQMVLAVLGDLISGYIHEELEESNFLSPPRASYMAIEFLQSGIDYLLKYGKFDKITVVMTPGNHGRTTKKRRVNTAIDNSFEWLIYNIISMIYRLEDRLEFIIADGYHTYLDIYGYKCRFHHGDSLKYGGGVGGITIPVKKAIAQWNKAVRADMDFFGHFHQFINHREFTCNGSMVGYNAFALSIKAEFEPATQGFMLINKKYGKSAIYPVILQ